MSSLSDTIKDFFYPQDTVCPLCGEEALLSGGICGECRAALRHAPKLPDIPDLDGLTCPYLYEQPVSGAVLRLKYGKATYLAQYLAGTIPLPDTFLFDCIVPVPLHPRRQRERGYNQSELLAHAFSALHHDIPVRTDLLTRTRYTTPQQSLTAEQRKKNLRKAFAATPQAAGHAILLLDDVSTTGSTLSACAEALRAQGATAVYGACVCIVPDVHQ